MGRKASQQPVDRNCDALITLAPHMMTVTLKVNHEICEISQDHRDVVGSPLVVPD